LIVGGVDPELKPFLDCALKDPQFQKHWKWLDDDTNVWNTTFSRCPTGGVDSSCWEPPGFFGLDPGEVHLDPQSRACVDVVEDLMHEVAEAYAKRKLGKSTNALIFGERPADPLPGESIASPAHNYAALTDSFVTCALAIVQSRFRKRRFERTRQEALSSLLIEAPFVFSLVTFVAMSTDDQGASAAAAIRAVVWGAIATAFVAQCIVLFWLAGLLSSVRRIGKESSIRSAILAAIHAVAPLVVLLWGQGLARLSAHALPLTLLLASACLSALFALNSQERNSKGASPAGPTEISVADNSGVIAAAMAAGFIATVAKALAEGSAPSLSANDLWRVLASSVYITVLWTGFVASSFYWRRSRGAVEVGAPPETPN
jgi:hypothetical protein